ncbi:MAG TPA: alpha/beta fold hydrolase [Lunatimonas sp.]|nr:alpha/beta fold hydrolase [Lunatimonas sp.]
MKKISPIIFLTAILMTSFMQEVISQSEEDIRKNYLKQLIRLQEKPSSHDGFVSYYDSTWLDWIERTGELPPNFEKLPSLPFLPDPLISGEGINNIAITNMGQWETQREYLKKQVKHIFSGTFPDPPDNLGYSILDEKSSDGMTIQMIELRFGKDKAAKLTIELFTPPGNGPFPVFMTQWNHRGWAQIAAKRGYMGLVYAGADSKDDTRDYLALFPDYDWTTLMTRAWGAHRAVDYLYTLDHVEKSQIAITGHSRNAKQSILAAAFDNRITAIISSSGGTGGEIPYRYNDEQYSNESIDFLVSRRTHWLHPRLRYYSGREHKLPIDQNSLMALIAPNSLMLSSSIREGGGGDPWAIEQNYISLTKVYSFLNAEDKLGIRLRDGEHGVSERDIEAFMDWLDIQFKRNDFNWENKLFYNYTFEKWKIESKEKLDTSDFSGTQESRVLLNKPIDIENFDRIKVEIKDKINWLLGEEPAGVPASPIAILSNREDYVSSYINRPTVKSGKKENIAPYNAIGDYLYGSLYYPTDSHGEKVTGPKGNMPVVIFLHKFSNTGYDASLNFLLESFLSQGVAVLTMDLIGYGARIEEGTNFYKRYPKWSKLGKMVRDTRGAVDALESLDFIDKDNIFVAGYALGGTVGLFTAAIEPRITGVAVASAFTPLRMASEHIEGLKAYSHLHGLIPKLGLFEGNELQIPVDFTEIMASIVPRPLLVITPTLDRHADFDQVETSIGEVKKIYELFREPKKLNFENPIGFNHFTRDQQELMINWVKDAMRE